jgi:hypothetical protein
MPLLAMAVVLCITGCPRSQDQNSANLNPVSTQDQAPDPAAANLAPASSDTNAAAPVTYTAPNNGQAPANPAYQQSAPPPDAGGNQYQASNQPSGDPGYGEQPVTYAPQPPPPLPDYDQPPAPGDGYLWTPGYWAWAPTGYYWVPGAWVQAPYEGALWTPGYWGFWHNHYGFYRGYWGPHIGFYGGVDYGFGYVGFGYQGGYWGGGHFNYNRSVNNINVSVVHNVYSRSVSGGNRGGARVSFNGGSGGVQLRARPAELAALHEQHAAPMRAQVQNERAASTNRAQFANVNHGRPASLVANQALAADRNVRAPAALQVRNQATAQQHQAVQQPQQHQAVQQQQQRQAVQQQQQRQAVQQPQQHQAVQQPQQRQAVQQQRQAAPQQHQAAPQQRQVAPQQHQAAPQHPEEERPKR